MLEQPDGLPVNYLCRLIGRAAWCKYVIMTKQENGVVEKVGNRQWILLAVLFLVLKLPRFKED